MPSPGMLHRVPHVRTEVTEENIVSITVTRIGDLGSALAVTNNRNTLRRNFLSPW
jgi:hypothetical protein